MNLTYRTAQFVRSFGARTKLQDLARTWPFLTEPQRALFLRLPAADQLHSLRVLDALVEAGESDPDLLASALLHDIGKIHRPLHLWERVFVVVVQGLAPQWAASWADEHGHALRSALAVAHNHPQWGAEMLAGTGASLRLIDLVRRHQDPPTEPPSDTDRPLRLLQQADNQS
jgi:putative nucleotidyltransferase with HDIG domain